MKKPGGIIYTWEETALALRSAEQQETYGRIEADGQGLQESDCNDGCGRGKQIAGHRRQV